MTKQLFIRHEATAAEYDLIATDGKVVFESVVIGHERAKVVMLPGLQIRITTDEPSENDPESGVITYASVWYDSNEHECLAVIGIKLDHSGAKYHYSFNDLHLPAFMAAFRVAHLEDLVGKRMTATFYRGRVWDVGPEMEE